MVEQDPKRKMSRLLCSIFRAAEIIFGGVVLILMVILLHNNRTLELRSVPFQSYLAVSTAGMSVIFAFLFLPQNDYFFRYFIVDFILCVLWFTSFALLLLRSAKDRSKTGCGQQMTEFGQIAMGGSCNSWRASWGFAFLSGCVWFGTFLIGVWVFSRTRKGKQGGGGKNGGGHH